MSAVINELSDRKIRNTKNKNYFPLLIRYQGRRRDEIVKTSKDIISNKRFVVLKTNASEEDVNEKAGARKLS